MVDASWFESCDRFLEALNCGAVVIDRAGRMVRVNTRICQMMRRSPAELVGQSLMELYQDDESRSFIAERRAAAGR